MQTEAIDYRIYPRSSIENNYQPNIENMDTENVQPSFQNRDLPIQQQAIPYTEHPALKYNPVYSMQTNCCQQG